MSFTGKGLFCKVADPVPCFDFIYKRNIGKKFVSELRSLIKHHVGYLLFVFITVTCNLSNSCQPGELCIFADKLRANMLCGKSVDLGTGPV